MRTSLLSKLDNLPLWSQAFDTVRNQSLHLAGGLSDADATAQSMEDASPTKWHLAHTTWFFETLLLKPHLPGYKPIDEAYNFLFNSYYETIGARHPRPMRGLLTRPSLDQVHDYRRHVDAAIHELIATEPGKDVITLIELGLHHEQQHQELLLTDILHLFAQNPTYPAYRAPAPLSLDDKAGAPQTWIAFDGGVKSFGHATSDGFAFDSEGPRHEALIRPFKLANRPVTNGEWIEFIEDKGYETTLLWLSDGWAHILQHRPQAPLYWQQRDGEWWSMTLRGLQPVDPKAPVTHVSYYEADAFATWAGARLPSEFEWEYAATGQPLEGNFAGSERYRPKPASSQTDGLQQMFGDVWEWTQSAFTAYPGFKPVEGAVGEYNGKFMCGQFVLRGGSCATPEHHIRASYRNFFQPEKQWQFSGLRLAQDN